MTRSFSVSILAFAFMVSFAFPVPAADEPSFEQSTLEIPRYRAGLHWAKLNNDSLADLLIADDAQFHLYLQRAGAGFGAESEQLIQASDGAIYDLADLDGDGVNEIVVLYPSGVDVYKFDPATGKMVRSSTPLLSGLRGASVQHLVPADVMSDIDGDGDEDLIYPVDGKYYLYFNDRGVFTKRNQISTKPISVRMSVGEAQISEEVTASVSIPGIEFVDLNADGRKDVHATSKERESFYLQSADGVIPENPTYEVDLSRFKGDKPAKSGAGNINPFQFVSKDLNGDERQDYMIVSGNKISVFLAGEQGVDFTKPSQILKVSAESMNAVLLPLNKDQLPDLVIIKYELPSLGRIVAGLAIGLRFEVEFLGYDNSAGSLFSKRPDHRSTMVFKVPPILKLLGELDSITQKFKDLQSQSKSAATGDFNGDGTSDVLKCSVDSIELYFGAPGQAVPVAESSEDRRGEEFISKILFEQKQRDVTLDTLLSVFSDFVNSFTSASIAGRQPSLVLKLQNAASDRIENIACHDLNGDGLDDAVLFLKDKEEESGNLPPGGANETQSLLLLLSQRK